MFELDNILSQLIPAPKDGYRPKESFSDEEKEMLRPIAETLAMLVGNAFFGMPTHDGSEWYEMYLPEAYEVFKSNGGLNGWAGEASFIKKYKQ